MKLLVEPSSKELLYLNQVSGIILPLKSFAVESSVFFSLEDIERISYEFRGEIFVKINKNLENDDIECVREILLFLDNLNIQGVFFYDLALLQLKKELGLKTNLVWNQTHMVNNYMTCNYYFDRGVRYALLGKEITLEEICEIINKSKITCMVEVVSRPSVAFSKRRLVTNYYQNLERGSYSRELKVREKVTDSYYRVVEDNNGTTFYLDEITNGTGIIKDLLFANCEYIIFREFGLEEDFLELVKDTRKYILGDCMDNQYIEKYKKLGDSTNFFFKKTIYRVKKNG